MKYLRVRYDGDVHFFKTGDIYVPRPEKDLTREEFAELILQYDLAKGDNLFDAIMMENYANIQQFIKNVKARK